MECQHPAAIRRQLAGICQLFRQQHDSFVDQRSDQCAGIHGPGRLHHRRGRLPGVLHGGQQNQRRPLYPRIPRKANTSGAIDQLEAGGTASYNALLLALRHRLSNNFTVLANYTYSHCITDPFVSELDSTASQYTDTTDRRFDRGNCIQIDHRQNFNLSGAAMSPKFSERWLRTVAGDWRL